MKEFENIPANVINTVRSLVGNEPILETLVPTAFTSPESHAYFEMVSGIQCEPFISWELIEWIREHANPTTHNLPPVQLGKRKRKERKDIK